jgi:hypothetical protein
MFRSRPRQRTRAGGDGASTYVYVAYAYAYCVTRLYRLSCGFYVHHTECEFTIMPSSPKGYRRILAVLVFHRLKFWLGVEHRSRSVATHAKPKIHYSMTHLASIWRHKSLVMNFNLLLRPPSCPRKCCGNTKISASWHKIYYVRVFTFF